MTETKAVELYLKLRPFLRVIPSIGFHLPARFRNNQLTTSHPGDWPLHHKPGYPTRPIAVTWNPKRPGMVPTFEEFLLVYKIPITRSELNLSPIEIALLQAVSEGRVYRDAQGKSHIKSHERNT